MYKDKREGDKRSEIAEKFQNTLKPQCKTLSLIIVIYFNFYIAN